MGIWRIWAILANFIWRALDQLEINRWGRRERWRCTLIDLWLDFVSLSCNEYDHQKWILHWESEDWFSSRYYSRVCEWWYEENDYLLYHSTLQHPGREMIDWLRHLVKRQTCMRSQNFTIPHPTFLTSGSMRINCVWSITRKRRSFLQEFLIPSNHPIQFQSTYRSFIWIVQAIKSPLSTNEKDQCREFSGMFIYLNRVCRFLSVNFPV